jgi:ABC-2 type transport system permease protein
MIFWGVGIGLLALLQIISIPSVDGMKATADAIAKMPPFIVQLIGGGDVTFLASPEGYLNNQYFAIVLVIFGVYAMIVGLNITANEETKGIMDLLLSLPVSRRQLVLEKFLAYCVLVTAVVAISTIIIYLGLAMTPAVSIPFSTLLAASVNIIPGTLTMLAFTAFVAAIVRRRGQATAIAVVFLIGSYFVDVLGRTVSTSFLNTLRVISFYAYYDSTGVVQHGLSLGNIGVLLAAAAVLIAGALWAFQRRDVAV